MNDFDIILGMKWLASCPASVDRFIVTLRKEGHPAFQLRGKKGVVGAHLISAFKADRLLNSGRERLACLCDGRERSLFGQFPIVRKFSCVPIRITGFATSEKINFTIESVPRMAPSSKAPNQMAPTNLRNLRINHELLDKDL